MFKMRTKLFLLAGTALLAACTTSEELAPPPAAVAEAAPPPAAPAPKPTIGTYGFDEAGMDRAVAPGDNFYQYSNGTWAKNTPIPADKSNYGMFTMLDDLSKEHTRVIIEDAAKDPGNKIGQAYASFLNEAAVEAKGLAPLQPWLDEIKALKSKSGYPALVRSEERRVGEE